MDKKWRWVLGITRATIVLLLPLLVWALFLPDGDYAITVLRILFPAWLIMIALVVLVVFGISEDG